MKTTDRRRLKDAHLVAIEGWVKADFAAIANAQIEATRPEVDRILALPPVDRRKIPHPPGSKPRGRPRKTARLKPEPPTKETKGCPS